MKEKEWRVIPYAPYYKISNYGEVYKFKGARLTAYGGDVSAAGGKPVAGKTCAGHNMPYGTKIYIPAMKGRAGCKTGIFTVNDTGGK